MSFETDFNTDNSNIFLREFTYDDSRFRSDSGQELELCDGAIWIDDLLILYQLKQRNPDHDTGDPDEESKWFTNKVSKTAVNQLVASITYLETQKSLPLANLRDQTVNLSDAAPTTIHKIVIYSSSESLPISKILLKGRVSKRIGFVHFFHASDYAAVSQTLYTPFEIAEYLAFRAEAATSNPAVDYVSEKALLGKYLSDSGMDVTPADETFVDRLIENRDEFSVGRLLWNYLDRVVWGNDGLQYHAILTELAKLRRNMLKILRDRFRWATQTCREEKLMKPSRFYFPDTECSFIVIPLPASQREDWQTTIQMYASLCKYDLRSQKCIAITVAPDPQSNDHYLVNWCYLAGPWRSDPEFDLFLAENKMFREMRAEMSGKYHFADA